MSAPCKTRTVKSEATLNQTVTPADWGTHFEALGFATLGDVITTLLRNDRPPVHQKTRRHIPQKRTSQMHRC